MKVFPVDEFIETFVAMLKKLTVHDFIAKMQARLLAAKEDLNDVVHCACRLMKTRRLH